MSASATGWCWEASPFSGVDFTLHLAVADVVNDEHDNTFYMAPCKLADKVRCSRQKASEWLWACVSSGWLELVEDNRKKVNPATGQRNVPSMFRFRRSCVTTDDAAASPQTTQDSQDSLFCVTTDDAAASPQTTHKKEPKKTFNSKPCDRAAFGALTQRGEKILDHLLALWDNPRLTPTQAGHVGGAVRWIAGLPPDGADDDGTPFPPFRDRVTEWAKWNDPTKLRQRSPLYDAVVVATGKWWKARTPAEEGRLASAVAGISKAQGTPEEVFDRARVYPTVITKGIRSAKALESNWGQLGAAVAREHYRPQPQELIMSIGSVS